MVYIEEMLGALTEFKEADRSWDVSNAGRLRPGATDIKANFPKDHKFNFAEIGVFSGSFSGALLKFFPIEDSAWFVDAWISPHASVEDQAKWNWLHQHASQKIYTYPKTRVVRAASIAAVKIVPDDLDFIYIDANHEYEQVLQDLELWYPKIKQGGWFWGDDYPAYPGVRQAVDEFTEKRGISLSGTSRGQWWLQKI